MVRLYLKGHCFLSKLLSPQNCIRCGCLSDYILCRQCLDYFYQIPVANRRCRVCGKILISEITTCISCTEDPLLVHTDSVFPVHAYRLWKKELLFQWKICGNRSFSIIAAEMFHTVLNRYYPSLPVIPVPPRPGKIRNKGWDQINDVCILLKLQYGCKILPVLNRIERKQQKKLSREERLHQLGRSYELKKNACIPAEVVVIDDIMTTGVTLENCAEVLKNAGVKKVHAVTLFIAD